MGRNILKSSVQNASFSIIFQILFRCMTFVLNAFIIRHVGQEVLGIMNVRLLLLESTILFLAKEPLLKACLTDTKSHNWAQVINQIWLSVPLSAILSMVLVYVWINVLSATDEIYLKQYQLGCYAVAVSCIVDQVTQPVLLVAQSFCFIKLKVMFETFYIVIRTFIFVHLVIKYPSEAINAFSIAQVVSSVLFCSFYYGYFAWYIHKLNNINKEKIEIKRSSMFYDMQDFKFKSITDFLPGLMPNNEAYLNKELCVLTTSFVKQCVVKQVLTEGERYVMTISPVLTFSQQSMYDIVNNLGSLAARFIFRPIEESSYFYFTQMIKRDVEIIEQDQKAVEETSEVLNQLCKIVTSIGFVVIVFGQAYSYSLLYLYGGHVLTDSLPVMLLKCHCLAVLLLAINGVTECYVFATMNNKQLDQYNYIMVIFSFMFLFLSYVFTNILGPVGFILANCINMFARICHSIYYINGKYKATSYKPLEGLLPTRTFITILLVSGLSTQISEVVILPRSLLFHIGVGALFFLLTLSVWGYENRSSLKLGFDKYKRRMSIIKED